MKTSSSLARMFKKDYPRAVDRYIDYFGLSEPHCRAGEPLTQAGEASPALASSESSRWLEASSA